MFAKNNIQREIKKKKKEKRKLLNRESLKGPNKMATPNKYLQR